MRGCIGIDEYRHWPDLEYAVNDAKSMEAKLRDLGFDEVIPIANKEAIRDEILMLLSRH